MLSGINTPPAILSLFCHGTTSKKGGSEAGPLLPLLSVSMMNDMFEMGLLEESGTD
jgi:hypothetical protein